MAAALADLVDRGIIHVIDLVFVRKDSVGNVAVIELDDLDEATGAVYESLSGEYGGLLNDEDIENAASDLAAGTGEVLIVWENLWAAGLIAAIGAAGGTVAEDLHIPAEIAEQALADEPTS
ncbi:hypothetical protein D1871_14815 [Nakamurella silvestris]|nr:hypothetical protein D1871_14815 [Nakamurella silvestris]